MPNTDMASMIMVILITLAAIAGGVFVPVTVFWFPAVWEGSVDGMSWLGKLGVIALIYVVIFIGWMVFCWAATV